MFSNPCIDIYIFKKGIGYGGIVLKNEGNKMREKMPRFRTYSQQTFTE